jgi:hypothetical protein
MKPMRSGVLGLLLAGLAAISPAGAVGGEDSGDPAAPVSTLDLNLDLFVGGITLGHAGMTARVQGSGYKAVSTLQTSGIVNAFWQSKIETSSSGTLAAGTVRPSLYDSFSQYRQAERRQVTLTFEPDGPVSVHAVPAYPPSSAEISYDQKKQSLDPLSAMVFLVNNMPATGQKPCEAVAPIYDGRRRYDVVFNYVKQTDIRMDNGIYSGPGYVCQIHYNQVAGYQQTVVKKGEKLPNIYAWVAALQSTADPTRRYMVPLRVWAETEYGLVVALASRLRVDGAPIGKRS